VLQSSANVCIVDSVDVCWKTGDVDETTTAPPVDGMLKETVTMPAEAAAVSRTSDDRDSSCGEGAPSELWESSSKVM